VVLGSASGTAVIDVLDNDSDPDGDALTIVLAPGQTSLGGSVTVGEGVVNYTPPSRLVQVDTFEYQARDPGGLTSSVATVSVRPSDRDGDGDFDVVDNCPSVSNADQNDMDSDELGDLCDPDPDGDGVPGLPGQSLPSGRSLVEANCLVCHNTPSTGAPQFNDEAAWNARLARGLDALVDSAVNGAGGGTMPGFGDQFSINELTAAVLYLSGSEDTAGEESEATELPDRDLDGVLDDTDNCPNLPNDDQRDLNDNDVGDACEPTADNDRDGYPVSLDDDDSNAGRLPGRVSGTGSSGGLFMSENALQIGRLSEVSANRSGSTSAGIVLGASAFLEAANTIRSEVTHQNDSEISSTVGVINVRIRELNDGAADLRIQLSANLPLTPMLRVYDIETGLWSDFNSSSSDTVASAASGDSDCPLSDSPNYSDGLQPGVACVRLTLSDGGPNDADGAVDGEVELIAGIGSRSGGGTGVGPIDIGSPSRSGGGVSGLVVWTMLLMMIGGRLLSGRMRRVTHAGEGA